MHEGMPLHEKHSLPYNNAKVRAEKILRALRSRGTVELVTLRPSVVYGPRSRWITQVADQLLERSAYLVDGGMGICNCVYIDNLIQAVMLASESRLADKGAFFVSDSETITWKDYYGRLANALGCHMDEISEISAPVFKLSMQDRFNRLKAMKAVMGASRFIPMRFKQAVKAGVAAWDKPSLSSAWALSGSTKINPSEEVCLLQQSAYKLPNLKAEKILGYRPVFSFAEGMRRSIEWLRFEGYPVTYV
jgi:nucleoside-diphosphate-sugar epimerase